MEQYDFKRDLGCRKNIIGMIKSQKVDARSGLAIEAQGGDVVKIVNLHQQAGRIHKYFLPSWIRTRTAQAQLAEAEGQLGYFIV